MSHRPLPPDAPLTCVIRAEGMLDPSWSDRLGGLCIRVTDAGGRPATRLSGRLLDQGALVGVLVALYDLGLVLVSVRCRAVTAGRPRAPDRNLHGGDAVMSELRLRLMGTPEVRLDGVRLSIQRRRALALLAFLAVTGRPHRREVLATLLAGDAAEAQAHKHLSNALTDLRAALGEYLVVERQTVAFDCDRPYWLDVAAIRSLLADGIPAGDVGAVQRAVDLYQDEFLAGLVLPDAPAFDEWLTLQREQLGQLLVRGLQTAIDHHARDGTAAEGIAAAQRLLAEDPWREEAHRQLMALLAASGQRSAALSQYEICRRVLAEELGVEPAAETRALYERLRSEPVAAPHNLPPAPAPLVGREAELDLLAQRLSEPASPVLSVVGPGRRGQVPPGAGVRPAGRHARPPAATCRSRTGSTWCPSPRRRPPPPVRPCPQAEATQQLAAAIADVVRRAGGRRGGAPSPWSRPCARRPCCSSWTTSTTWRPGSGCCATSSARRPGSSSC